MSARAGRWLAAWLLAASVCHVAAPASAGVSTLTPIRDNTLFQDADGSTSSGAGPALFAGVTSQGKTRRALLRFDVSAGLPPGARIDSVVLALHVSNAPNAIAREFTLHRVVRDWGEGTSSSSGGTGAPATADDATWTHAFHLGEAWSAPGGDFAPNPSGSSLVGDIDTYTWGSARMTADVRSWISDPNSNYGWLLRGEEADLGTARRFDSREAPGSTKPILSIFYTQAASAPPISWGGIKAIYRRGAP